MWHKGFVTIGEDPDNEGWLCYWVIAPWRDFDPTAEKVIAWFYSVPIKLMRKIVNVRKLSCKIGGDHGTDPESVRIRDFPTQPDLLTWCKKQQQVGLLRRHAATFTIIRSRSEIDPTDFIMKRFLSRG